MRNSVAQDPEGNLAEWRKHEDIFQWMPPKFIEKIKSVDDEIYGWTERQLFEKTNPTYVDNTIRLNFWTAVKKCRKEKRMVNVKQEVIAGVCSESYFYGIFLKTPHKIAWMMRPIVNFHQQIQTLHDIMLMRMNEVAQIPFHNKSGEFQVRNVQTFMKAYEIIDNRLNGMATQKIQMDGKMQSKHDHNHEHKHKAIIPKPEQLRDMGEKIRQLEAKAKPDIIDATIASASKSD